MKNSVRTSALIFLSIFLFSFLVAAAVFWKLGLAKPMESDAAYFLELAENLSVGRGYVLDHTFWPGERSMRRFPGWPFVVSLVLRGVGDVDPSTVMRWLTLLVHAAGSGVIGLLAWQLFARARAAFVAGAAHALHPAGWYFAHAGLSEPLFVLLIALGALFFVSRRRFCMPGAALVLGCAVLVRGSLIAWLLLAAVFSAISLVRQGCWPKPRALRLAVLFAFVFLAPSGLWAVRNRQVCGEFPVLSTIRGQTFYGGNNAVVAGTLDYWGYWVFPDEIPGEPTMRELAATLSEREVDQYYHEQGMRYILANKLAMPRLLLGKLIRAFVPIPWKPVLGSCVVSAYRWLLYVCFAVGAVRMWRQTDMRYRFFFLSMCATTMLTVLVFWGNARFAYSLEPLLMPFVGMASRRDKRR